MSITQIPLAQVFRSKGGDTHTLTSSTSSTSSLLATNPTPIPPQLTTTTSNRNLPPTMSQPIQVQFPRGTRTPKMLEYERQAEERAREQEKMVEERALILETELKIQKEQERIAQEEYEMKQYYEAEALKHAEEVRLHQEEVRKHQERVREHERRVMDHEASSEAFAKVIAMPAKPGRDRQVSFYNLGQKGRSGSLSSGANMNVRSPDRYLNGNGV